MRTARKHLHWYTARLPGGAQFRHAINAVESAGAQIDAVEQFFARLAADGERLCYAAVTRDGDESAPTRAGSAHATQAQDGWTEALAA
jgi:tRNA-dihydrouridine synthase B